MIFQQCAVKKPKKTDNPTVKKSTVSKAEFNSVQDKYGELEKLLLKRDNEIKSLKNQLSCLEEKNLVLTNAYSKCFTFLHFFL